MTTGHDQVDLDLLADFVGGVFDGTDEESTLRHLVRTDPAWTEAYAALLAADDLVRQDLRALGDGAESVPADVAQKLNVALARAAVAPVVPIRPSRFRRFVPALVAAAVLVVCAGAGVAVLHGGVLDKSAGNSIADERAGAPAVKAPTSAPPVEHSGRNYTADTLPEAGAGGFAPGGIQPNSESGALSRLGDPTALQACLGAIIKTYGGQVELVDYARFGGSPVLVVVLAGNASGRLAVVVGPACGLAGSGTDERYHGSI